MTGEASGDERQPRLVATDLDGTLLHSDGTVTTYTREVLRAVDARGVPVVFTTGRPVRWMEELWADVGGHGLAICSNGGIVYDVSARAVRDVRPISRVVAEEMVERLRRELPDISFALEHVGGWAGEAAYPRRRDATEDAEPDRPETLLDAWRDDVVKVLVTCPDADPEEFWGDVEERVGDLVTTTWSSTYALVEVSAKGVTKASTLATLAAELGIAAADVVAFGDMPNDLPMLDWAGRSYAMAGGHPSVLAAADHVAPSHDDDGVAQVLAQLFRSA